MSDSLTNYPQWVLGWYAGHDASVALVGDGRIIHLEKERYTRRKHDSGIIDDLVPEALRLAGVGMDAVGAFATAGRESPWLGHINQHMQRNAERFGATRPEYVLPHHLAHAAYAFYTSPYERAGIVTVDGGGDNLERDGVTDIVGHAVGYANHLFGDALVRFRIEVSQERSIGHDWAAIALELFPESGLSGAGQVMALAGVNAARFPETGFDLAVGAKAQALQDRTEQVFREHALKALGASRFDAIADTGQPNNADGCVVLAGGCALNGLAMYGLLSSGIARAVHVPPAVHDGGLSVGAALHALHALLGEPRRHYVPRDVAFAGYVDAELAAAPPVEPVADAIVRHETVCVAHGRAESGPRALGHRSILGDARSLAVRDRLNVMKGRQRWRPVAPVVCWDDAPRYFDVVDPEACQYMTVIVPVTEETKAVAPAAVHDDGSARVQVVSLRSWLGQVVRAVGERTGVPIVLNTSFNAAGEAMVNNTAQARDSFARLGADWLAVGGSLTKR